MANCFCVGKLPSCTCDARCRCDGCTCEWEKFPEIEIVTGTLAAPDIEIKPKPLKYRLPPNCS